MRCGCVAFATLGDWISSSHSFAESFGFTAEFRSTRETDRRRKAAWYSQLITDYNIVMVKSLDGFHKNSTVDLLSARHSVYAGRVQGKKSSRSPLHRAAAIHFIHFNEAAAINRSAEIITNL